jgi:hypothetical protein
MAHFAQLGEDNTVIQTIVVHNEEIQHLPFPESEPLGIAFCQSLFGPDTSWVQTSINANFRKYYGFPGCAYDPVHDVFRAPKPFDSWRFDIIEKDWVPPVDRPTPTTPIWLWNEAEQQWMNNPYAMPDYEVE